MRGHRNSRYLAPHGEVGPLFEGASDEVGEEGVICALIVDELCNNCSYEIYKNKKEDHT